MSQLAAARKAHYWLLKQEAKARCACTKLRWRRRIVEMQLHISALQSESRNTHKKG